MDQMISKQLDVAGIFRHSWQHYKRNWKVLTVVAAVIGVASLFLDRRTDDVSIIMMLLSIVVGMVGQLMVLNASLGAVRGTVAYGLLWNNLNRLVPLFATSMLVGLLVLVGFILLVIPGIVLMVSLQFAQYFVVDQKKGVVESLYASADATRGVRWQILGILVALVIVNVLGALPFGVGLLVTIPLTYVVLAEVYDQLTKLSRTNRVTAV